MLTTISTSKKTYIQNNNAPGANAGMIYNLTTMEKYDYKEHVSEDVRGYISNHYTREELKSLADDLDELGKKLHDKMWMDDSVTGNRSGSYTCNTWQAEEFLCHNLDLLQEVGFAFCEDLDLSSPEICDVSIRCYLLDDCISEVLNADYSDLYD